VRFERETAVGNGCVVETDVAGQGQEARILPGEQVTIAFDCQVWRNPARYPIHQIVAGIGDQPLFGCLYNDVPPPYPGVSFRKTFDFVSANPGVFEVCVYWGLWYTCRDALDAYPAHRQVVATIEVAPPTPEIPAVLILGPAAVGVAIIAAAEVM